MPKNLPSAKLTLQIHSRIKNQERGKTLEGEWNAMREGKVWTGVGVCFGVLGWLAWTFT